MQERTSPWVTRGAKAVDLDTRRGVSIRRDWHAAVVVVAEIAEAGTEAESPTKEVKIVTVAHRRKISETFQEKN